jgi:hypothetical protein
VKAIKALLAQVEDYQKLQAEAASLAVELRLARALAGEEKELWKQVAPRSIERLLLGVLNWSLTTDYNPALAPPDLVVKGTLLRFYHKVPWQLLIWWAMTGLTSETERLVLKNG